MDELEKARINIANTANENFKIIKAEIDALKPNEKLSSNSLWKLKKKLCPNSTTPPTAMLDKCGHLLTSNEAIEERALEAYKERLSANKMNDNLTNLEKENNKLFEARMKLVKLNKSDPWDTEDLLVVLKKLGKDKSRDANDFCNEIFQEGVAGSDLIDAVHKIMNLIKSATISKSNGEI